LYRGQVVSGAVPTTVDGKNNSDEEAKKRQIKDLRRIGTFITGAHESPISFAITL
jgi:hypothetical protein